MNALQQNHRILKDMTSTYLSPSIKLIELYNFTHYLGEIYHVFVRSLLLGLYTLYNQTIKFSILLAAKFNTFVCSLYSSCQLDNVKKYGPLQRDRKLGSLPLDGKKGQ